MQVVGLMVKILTYYITIIWRQMVACAHPVVCDGGSVRMFRASILVSLAQLQQPLRQQQQLQPRQQRLRRHRQLVQQRQQARVSMSPPKCHKIVERLM